MPKIVECIPNFSEARRPEVIDQIVVAAGVPGVNILDLSSDMDHNRTVLTFAGTPEGVEEAAFRVIQKAAQLIDLNVHSGEHPRIGATDVVPFVPISGMSMAECVDMAKRLGKRVGEELNIPVYLYEAAATKPERTNLENIRKGQYEGLKLDVLTNPERKPDFGPAQLGTAGATVIGARAPLIAFNVYLNTEDVSIAKAIAKVVRHSSGGLRFVKAAGFLVDGRAQVSMNLTDYRQTAVARVVETIRREAQRYGVGMHHSELVGLIPQEALVDAAVWYMQLDQFSPEQVLETRLSAAAKVEQPSSSADDFLNNLAAPTPAPGGGCAAAYAGAMGAGLVAMVSGLTVGRKKYAAVEEEMKGILSKAEVLKSELNAAVLDDAGAFEAVMSAYKMPKETPEQEALRRVELERATLYAALVPMQTARHACRVMELALQTVLEGNMNAISDGASAAYMAHAALKAAATNVRINIATLMDKTPGEPLLLEIKILEDRAESMDAEIKQALQHRAGLVF